MPALGLVVVVSRRRLFVDFLSLLLRDDVLAFPGSLEELRSSTGATVIVDLESDGASLEDVRTTLERLPDVRVIGFFDEFGSTAARRAFELGAVSLFSTYDEVDRIHSAITRRDQSEHREPTRHKRDARRRLSLLTRRELEVASLAALGQTDREVAQSLGITAHTVRSHLRNCYKKLDVGSQVTLANLFRDGWS